MRPFCYPYYNKLECGVITLLINKQAKDQLIEKRADSRRRVTLGSEVANKEVQLAVLEADSDD